LAREPDHVSSKLRLAAALVDLSEYDEGVRLYEEAIRLRPGDANLHNDLARTKRTRDLLNRIDLTMQALARLHLRPDTAADGTACLAPNRGTASDATLPGRFVWRCPPPAGGAICLPGPGDAAAHRRPQPFYACSELAIAGKRIFVFPAPVGTRLLSDEDVSWFWQRPLADLTEEQLTQEAAFRKARNLRFPLATLPDSGAAK
jgi:hypothetical protein